MRTACTSRLTPELDPLDRRTEATPPSFSDARKLVSTCTNIRTTVLLVIELDNRQTISAVLECPVFPDFYDKIKYISNTPACFTELHSISPYTVGSCIIFSKSVCLL